MASALLIDKDLTSRTHSGILCLLGQEFASKGLLDKDDVRLVSRLQNMRQAEIMMICSTGREKMFIHYLNERNI